MRFRDLPWPHGSTWAGREAWPGVGYAYALAYSVQDQLDRGVIEAVYWRTDSVQDITLRLTPPREE